MEQAEKQDDLPQPLQAISDLIQAETQTVEDNPEALLALLRLLEKLHREIREDVFLKVLPTSRQALYALLRDIEQEGGWPYIPRFKLQKFLQDSEKNRSHD